MKGETANDSSSLLRHSEDSGKDEVPAPENIQDVTMGPEEDEILDPCDKESEVLRNVQVGPTKTHRVIYPLDALTSEEAQKWFPQAFAYLDVELGPEYMDFLVTWIDFERLHNWEKNGGRLEKAGRPKELTTWISEGRYLPCCKGPDVTGGFVEHFPDDMCSWWTFLQSSSSVEGGASIEQWSRLDKHGINGWFSIIAAMKWWGEGLKGTSGDSLRNGTERWLAMVKVMTTALKSLKK
ncbi:hypothetical protein K435DRAFT_793284 [Dendrothele bispora CBS 962.96]|uniref:Uncharacterized protein n=1 Tax=Dendrothele bispora (strain CBS 962.96) TaxID=1314807 RepID=A0A4S8MFU1_DENBC|nr:hypothetical protein K435DRAFT_793284 [Dendrothele bispora CBS 962.96]